MRAMRTYLRLAAGLAALTASAAFAQTTRLNIDYETGTTDSGIFRLVATEAPAADAAYIVDGEARSGRYALAHKVTWTDPGYVSFGAPRSEAHASSVRDGALKPGQYAPGQHRLYTFSVMLKDWEDWNGAPGPAPVDIVWQFKHFNGGPDFYVGVRRNQMILRYGEKQAVLIDDVRPYDNRWLDFRFEIYWAKDDSGYYTAEVKRDGDADYTLKAAEAAYPTFDPAYAGTAGTIQWGLYRPDAAKVPGATPTRIVLHDDIRVIELP